MSFISKTTKFSSVLKWYIALFIIICKVTLLLKTWWNQEENSGTLLYEATCFILFEIYLFSNGQKMELELSISKRKLRMDWNPQPYGFRRYLSQRLIYAGLNEAGSQNTIYFPLISIFSQQDWKAPVDVPWTARLYPPQFLIKFSSTWHTVRSLLIFVFPSIIHL